MQPNKNYIQTFCPLSRKFTMILHFFYYVQDIPKDAGMIAEIEFYPVNSQNILVPGDISSQTNYQLAANTPGTPVCTTPSGASTPGGGTNSGASGGTLNIDDVFFTNLDPRFS